MSCSGHHFSVHSPDCRAHLNIQSNRPIQVEPLSESSRVSTPAAGLQVSRSSQHLQTPTLVQIQTGADCLGADSMSPVPVGQALVGQYDQQQANDGNYTLVILDCSTSPHRQRTGPAGASAGSCESVCLEPTSQSGCHCQTELIVRQQIEHDHACMLHSAGDGHQSPHSPKQQYQQLQIAERSASRTESGSTAEKSAAASSTNAATTVTGTTSTITTTTTTTHQNSMTRQNQRESQERAAQGKYQVSANERVASATGSSPNSNSRIYSDFDENRQAQQQPQPQPQPTKPQQQHQPQPQQHEPKQLQQPKPQTQQPRAARQGTRLVKRWNWNQAQFVEEEVPERAQQRPQVRQLLQEPGAGFQRRSADLWNQDDEELRNFCAQMSPQPPAGSEQQRQARTYDPSWLAYRKPDEESVQADPLYRDLMAELERLEEGVAEQRRQQQAALTASQPPYVITPDCQQKPVFGQPLQPESVELNECDSVEFIGRLIPSSDPSMQIEWTKNGLPLMESSRLLCEFEFGVVRLLIKRCEAEDSGIYQCRARNSLGEVVSRSRLLVHAKEIVQYETLHPAGLDKIRLLENPPEAKQAQDDRGPGQAPKFLTHIQDYVERDEGDSVHFECCLGPVDDPDLKTEWFFNGRPLVTGSRFHTIDDFGFIVLDIDWLFPRDTGEYICRATNKLGSDFTRTVLRVRPAQNIIFESQLNNADVTIDKLRQLEFPDVEVEDFVDEETRKPAHFVQVLKSAENKKAFLEGDNVHFEARVGPASDGQLTVEWFHNGKPLISGHRFKPTFDFGHIQLDILYVYPEDSGEYKCFARNALGEAQSTFEIFVQGKQAINYQSQLPREMLGGVEKITEMEAMWNKAPDPEEEEAPAERVAPQFVLQPKACAAFEGSCARFCCRILANPRPRVSWFINNQLVVSGSRYKLTHDGMYHLTIPKCALSDAGKVEVRAKNLLGECKSETSLTVKRKVDDYRGVLKNSPNPWYDEQTLRQYRRQRLDIEEEENGDGAESEDFETFMINFQRQRQQHHHRQQQLKIATELQSTSPLENQVVGYMDGPDTPDVNLLASLAGGARSPLVEPGDMHPVVMEQHSVMAPAPSTVRRALDQGRATEAAEAVELAAVQRSQQGGDRAAGPDDGDQARRVFGLTRRLVPGGSAPATLSTDSAGRARAGDYAGSQRRLPPPSPENVEHGKEVHSHFHTQIQVEHQPNREITREIIEKETFEQEHKGFQKDNLSLVRGEDEVQRSELARNNTPVRIAFSSAPALGKQQQQQRQQQSLSQQQQQQRQQQSLSQQQQVFTGAASDQFVAITTAMIPPEFVQKIQPCQAIEGDEARFECQFRGEPQPTISWFRESKLLKPSNLYAIETDFSSSKSSLTIKRVTLNGNAVYTVKAENSAGSAKSSANLVVEAHPRPQTSRAGHARQFDASEHLEGSSASHQFHGAQFAASFGSSPSPSATSDIRGSLASPAPSDYDESLPGDLFSSAGGRPHSVASVASTGGLSSQSQFKVIKSVRTRRLSPDDLASLIRASPEHLIAPTFLHTIHEVHAKLGELARLDARLIGGQPMEVRWLRNGERVFADKQHKLLLEGDLYTLLILECAAPDEGYYECVASNSVGEARCGANLRVLADGRLSSPVGSVSSWSRAFAGGSLAATSGGGWNQQQVHSALATSADWTSHQVAGPASGLASEATTTTTVTSKTSAAGGRPSDQQVSASLQASSVGKQVEAAAGQQRTHFGLSRQTHHQLMSEYTSTNEPVGHGTPSGGGAIPKLIKGLESRQQVLEGRPLTMRCQISAFPRAEVSWLKWDEESANFKLIKPSKYFRIFKDNDETHCLKILEAFPEDQGRYKCLARAQNGQVETSALVLVVPNETAAEAAAKAAPK